MLIFLATPFLIFHHLNAFSKPPALESFPLPAINVRVPNKGSDLRPYQPFPTKSLPGHSNPHLSTPTASTSIWERPLNSRSSFLNGTWHIFTLLLFHCYVKQCSHTDCTMLFPLELFLLYLPSPCIIVIIIHLVTPPKTSGNYLYLPDQPQSDTVCKYDSNYFLLSILIVPYNLKSNIYFSLNDFTASNSTLTSISISLT